MRKKNVFNKFQGIYNEVLKKIKEGPNADEISKLIEKLSSEQLLDRQLEHKLRNEFAELYNYKLKAIHEIEEYIIDFKWLRNPSVKTLEQIRYFITHNCSYKDTIAKFGVELSALQVCIYRASIALESKIGVETMDLLANSKSKEEVDMAMNIFTTHIGYVKTSELLVKEAGKELPEAKRGIDIEPQDCLKELSFIRTYSVGALKKALKNINMDKLAFIFYILEEDNSNLKYEKALYYKFLNFSISSEELKKSMSDLQREKLYNRL